MFYNFLHLLKKKYLFREQLFVYGDKTKFIIQFEAFFFYFEEDIIILRVVLTSILRNPLVEVLS